ncbi:NAD kinase [Sungkyunkwania multivorans]|uniref:NAD kinase n=1 Tax=Sungkyunkwania multivorans TaxID=1173618 RepID=A0ABW3D0Q5_9FLAO
MKIAIYGQAYQKVAVKSVDKLLTSLSAMGADIFIEEDYLHKLKMSSIDNRYGCFSKLDKSFDLLFSIGGDGTILRAITYVKDLGIPIMGINTGRLGFLATLQTEDIEVATKEIFAKRFSLEERSLLSISTTNGKKDFGQLNFALNEIAISRKNTTSMITVETYLNDEYLTNYWADGLIIATPTGSTGYSLSCGGPVITPNTNSFVLTPIAPHNLNARPLVIPDSTKIMLKASGREDHHLVSLDSRIFTIRNNTTLIIERAPFNIKMTQLHDQSFFKTLRKKLLWGADRRN